MLLDAFTMWQEEFEPADDGSTRADIEMFLSWRINYSTGELLRFRTDDLDEFLLSWCPRKWSVAPNFWGPLIEALDAYFRFLAETGLGSMTASRTTEVITHLHASSASFLDAMADPSNFGLGKSMMMGPAFAGADIDFDDPASIQAAIDRFNNLPFEERKALTDPGFERLAQQRSAPADMDLPPLRRPSPAAVQRSAQDSPLVAKIAGLRAHLGDKGKGLTQKGNLKLVDCKALVAGLDTGDAYDGVIGARVYRTASIEDLPGLLYVVEAAQAAGAVRKVKNVLMPIKKWPSDPLVAATRAAMAMFEIGMASWGWSSGHYHDRVRDTLDGGVPFMLAPAVAFERYFLAEDLVPVAMGAVRQLPGRPPWVANDERLQASVETYLERLLDKLVLAGICITEADGFKVTPLGRQIMIDLMAKAGLRITELPSAADLSAAALLASIEDAPTMPVDELWVEWQPSWSAADKIEALVAALDGPTTATTRSATMMLLGVEPVIAEPYVRGLLDTVFASHAAAWLLAQDLELPADAEAAAIGVGVACDFLWQIVEHDGPGEMCQMLTTMIDQDLLVIFVDDLARCDFDEVADVLAAIGAAFPDRRVAKAAKGALHKFKSRRGRRSTGPTDPWSGS